MTCGNFPPMAGGQPQRGEVPSPSRPPLPSPAPSWGWHGRGPAAPGRRTRHLSLPAPRLAPEACSWGWRAHPPTQEPWALLGAATCLAPAPGRPLPNIRKQRRQCPPRHARAGTLAPRQTCSDLYKTHSHRHRDTPAQRTHKHTRARARTHRSPQAQSHPSPTETGPRHKHRSTQKHRGMGTHTERSKQRTIAGLESQSATDSDVPVQVLHPLTLA